jgi:ribosomal protein S18 acetylase RimI-like enzyme
MLIRPLAAADRGPLEEVLRATDAFTEEEVQVALELIDLGLKSPPSSDYLFVVAAEGSSVLGYACWGPVPLTDRVHDLYWIAVDPRRQKGGVGRALLEEVERRLRAAGQRMLLIETASKESYASTRRFYERTGYDEVSRLRDFYRDGDDKVVYGKRFT